MPRNYTRRGNALRKPYVKKNHTWFECSYCGTKDKGQPNRFLCPVCKKDTLTKIKKPEFGK